MDPRGWTPQLLTSPECRAFQLVGGGSRIRFAVWRGRLSKGLYNGLKSLATPSLSASVRERWSVSSPQSFAGSDNTGEDRRFLVVSCPGVASTVLKSDQAIPWLLVRYLQEHFKTLGPEPPKEKPDAQVEAGPQCDPQAAGQSVEGDSAAGGEASEVVRRPVKRSISNLPLTEYLHAKALAKQKAKNKKNSAAVKAALRRKKEEARGL